MKAGASHGELIGKLTIIGSDNGLSPGRRRTITRTNAGILLIVILATNLGEFLIGIQTFSFQKLNLETSSAKWRLFCLGLNELMGNVLKVNKVLLKDDDGAIYLNYYHAWLFYLKTANRRALWWRDKPYGECAWLANENTDICDTNGISKQVLQTLSWKICCNLFQSDTK